IVKDDGSLWIIVDAWREGNTYRLLPFDIVNRATAIGWKLRDIIIWDKQYTIPYYQNGQLRATYEYVLFFTKSDSYKFYLDRIRDTENLSIWWVDFPERFNPQGRSPTNIWRFPLRPQGAWRGRREEWRHSCPFPTELVARIIELTTDKGDCVLDPFAGSGVVPATAAAMGRHFLGVELNKSFVAQFHTVVKRAVAEELKGLSSSDDARRRFNGSFGSTILKLRALKYARKVSTALESGLRRARKTDARSMTSILACFCLAEIPRKFIRGDTLVVGFFFYYSGKRRPLESALAELRPLLKIPPLSNFRIECSIHFLGDWKLLRRIITQFKTWYIYTKVRTRSFEVTRSGSYLVSNPPQQGAPKIIPIISNLRVDVSWMADSYGVSPLLPG
ncbi:MAG: site-specific DNA-methyltransferase, partial [Spirochaetes bacterium]|nr:site-specific DNA-methyltransferase [Spirochaetota bacterium]